ncbi:MAG: nucleotidyltransferase domain-containing protein [Patescibacteria group bacterium]
MGIQQIRTGVRKALERSPSRGSVRRIALFGSQLHGEAGAGSDIDLLIEFRSPVGFFTLLEIQDALEESLQHPVDLRTPAELSRYFRDDVLAEAQSLYEG